VICNRLLVVIIKERGCIARQKTSDTNFLPERQVRRAQINTKIDYSPHPPNDDVRQEACYIEEQYKQPYFNIYFASIVRNRLQ